MKIIKTDKLPILSWCENPEDSCISQAIDLANHPQTYKHVALMPDTHAGKGMPIGGVVAFENAVCPNAVGADIACGMMAAKTNLKRKDITKDNLKDLIPLVKKTVPMGFNHQPAEQAYKNRKRADEIVSKFYEMDDSI